MYNINIIININIMSKTLENLSKAFAGESQARNRYTMYSKVAKKEGYEQIAAIFLETAEQEREHATKLFEYINEIKGDLNVVNVETSVPNIYSNTIDNLKSAIAGETEETEHMYPDFAKVALEEGYQKISNKLNLIAVAEKHHKERYEKLLNNLESGEVFKKGKKVFWVCRECGFVYYGENAPEVCPCCDHPQAFYQVQEESYN